MHIIFETPRLILRRFTFDDAPLVLKLNNDPDVLKYLHEPMLTTQDEAREVISKIIMPQYDHNLGRWAMITKDEKAFIGWCGLKYRPELDEIDLGYRLIKNAWGKGFATEAARETLDYAFQTLRAELITGRAHIENIASQKVMEKIGMQCTGEGIVDECPVLTYTASLSAYRG